MANYGTHTYNTNIHGWLNYSENKVVILKSVEEDGLEWEVSITVICTSPYVPAQLCGLLENCYPAEGPEYEFAEFEFFAGKKIICRSKSWSMAEALFGANIWNHLYDDAVTDAEENPPEEGEP